MRLLKIPYQKFTKIYQFDSLVDGSLIIIYKRNECLIGDSGWIIYPAENMYFVNGIISTKEELFASLTEEEQLKELFNMDEW